MRMMIQCVPEAGYKFSGGVYNTFTDEDSDIFVRDDDGYAVELDHLKDLPEYYEITYLKDADMKILRVDCGVADFITEQEFLDYLKREYCDCVDFKDCFDKDVYFFFKVEEDNITRIKAKDISVSFTPSFSLK